MSDEEQLTELLKQWGNGDRALRDRVLSIIFTQLKQIASRHLKKSGRSTLQTTELANEAYLKLAGQHKNDWQNRAHFFAITSHLIRRVVVDHTRKRLAQKHGGDVVFVTLDDSASGIYAPDRYPDWMILDEKLNQLGEIDSVAVKVVEMRFLTGLSIEETAGGLGVSTKTINRKWRFARAWLQQELSELQ